MPSYGAAVRYGDLQPIDLRALIGASRLMPVGPQNARAMIAELEVATLLAGFRGRPATDLDALVAAICGLSDLYLDYRHLMSDIECNPLIVLPAGKGVRAVDVRVASAGA